MNKTCLNCNQETSLNYCPNCGQSTSTHKYSIKHALSHDFVHGVFHLDKGIIYTVTELFTRPGHSIREFIEGKRVKHFNYFTLILILIAAGQLLGRYTTVSLAELSTDSSKEMVSGLEKFTKEYPKLVMLAMIPLYSLFSYLLFRKSKLNFTEHLILDTYRTAGTLILFFPLTILTIFYNNIDVLKVVMNLLTLGVIAYSTWFYYQCFSVFGYTKKRLFFKSLLVSVY